MEIFWWHRKTGAIFIHHSPIHPFLLLLQEEASTTALVTKAEVFVPMLTSHSQSRWNVCTKILEIANV